MALDDPAHIQAIDERYRAQARPATILWNDTIATIVNHRSVRAYLTTPLPDHTVETLITAAQSAASSSHLQYWSVIAVTDRAIKGELAALAGHQRHIDEAPLLLVFVADLARTKAVGDRAGAPTDGLDYLDSLLVGATDAALAAQNATLAAESLGLGTVYIGALRNKSQQVAELLDLPQRSTVVFGLVVGHADPEKPTGIKPRLPQSVILHDNRYSAIGDEDAIATFDAVSLSFQASQALPETGWVAPVLARSAGPAALNGRDKLRDIYADRDLPLL